MNFSYLIKKNSLFAHEPFVSMNWFDNIFQRRRFFFQITYFKIRFGIISDKIFKEHNTARKIYRLRNFALLGKYYYMQKKKTKTDNGDAWNTIYNPLCRNLINLNHGILIRWWGIGALWSLRPGT